MEDEPRNPPDDTPGDAADRDASERMDREAILRRRRFFIATAMASMVAGCAESVGPNTPRADAYEVAPQPCLDTVAVDAGPQPCLAPPFDSGPQPCLGIALDAGPQPCLDVSTPDE